MEFWEQIRDTIFCLECVGGENDMNEAGVM